jgi:hypothetical protein
MPQAFQHEMLQIGQIVWAQKPFEFAVGLLIGLCQHKYGAVRNIIGKW